MSNVLIIIIIFGFIIGLIFLQIYLSKKKNKWFGLILPIISFCFSIIAVSGMTMYTQQKSTNVKIVDENGNTVQGVTENEPITNQIVDIPALIMSGIAIFLLYNMSTVVLVLIYMGCRGKQKKNLELNKMNIQDL